MKLAGPIVVSSRVTILYEPVPEVRKKVFDLESALTSDFLSPTIIPVPDDAPGEIPRIEFQSKHGHSLIRVSQVRADLLTTYDEHFRTDVDKCFEYIITKNQLLNKVVDILSPNIAVTGLSITVHWPETEISQHESARTLVSKYLPSCLSEQKIFDFKVNRTVHLSDELYLLSTINNYRIYSSKSAIETPYPSLHNLSLTEFGLEMELEVNDRSAFNETASRSKGVSRVPEFIEHLRGHINNPHCI
jgi:hypothetical protein